MKKKTIVLKRFSVRKLPVKAGALLYLLNTSERLLRTHGGFAGAYTWLGRGHPRRQLSIPLSGCIQKQVGAAVEGAQAWERSEVRISVKGAVGGWWGAGVVEVVRSDFCGGGRGGSGGEFVRSDFWPPDTLLLVLLLAIGVCKVLWFQRFLAGGKCVEKGYERSQETPK